MRTHGGIRSQIAKVGASALLAAALVCLSPAFATASLSPGPDDVILTIAEDTVNTSRATGQRAMEGIVRNDTGDAVYGVDVAVGWAEDPARFDPATVADPALAPGAWSTYTLDWPSDVPEGWTPIVTAHGSSGDAVRRELVVDDVVPISSPYEGPRYYTVTVSNPTGQRLDSLRLSGIERNMFGDFVDVVHNDPLPSSLAAGDSAQFVVFSRHGQGGTDIPDIRVTAVHSALVTLTASTLSPVSGAPVELTLRIADASGAPIVVAHDVELRVSSDGASWTVAKSWTQLSESTTSVVVGAVTHYQATVGDTCDRVYPSSNVVVLTPVAPVVTPAAPEQPPYATLPKVHTARPRIRRAFTVTGVIRGWNVDVGAPVVLRFYRYQNHHWLPRYAVAVARAPWGSYRSRIVLRLRGQWRFRAILPSGFASRYRYIRVR